MEDADKSGTVANVVKDFVLQLKDEAMHHNLAASGNSGQTCDCQPKVEGGKPFLCIGAHVMRILNAAKSRQDPLYGDMDMMEREQIVQAAIAATHMV